MSEFGKIGLPDNNQSSIEHDLKEIRAAIHKHAELLYDLEIRLAKLERKTETDYERLVRVQREELGILKGKPAEEKGSDRRKYDRRKI